MCTMDGFGFAASGTPTTATPAGSETVSGSLYSPGLVGLGMIVSPLFDFILASVDEHEVGSAAGVLNAVQQLAGAIGVAVFGTIFFTELRHAGFVAAIDRTLLIEACTAPVLVALCGLLPRRAREQPEHGEHGVPAEPGEREQRAAYIAAGVD